MVSIRKLAARVLAIAVVLLLATMLYVLIFGFRLNLNKHLPVPEMSDKEVHGLLEALRLPDMANVSAMRVVFSKDGAGGSVRISARVRISRSQFDEMFGGSWMKSHQVTASKFAEYQLALPPEYEFDWWEALPLRAGDERFDMPLEEPPYRNYVMCVIRKSESVVDLYFVRAAHSDYLPPIVFKTMRRGRSPTPGFPSQIHFYEIKKGEF